MALERAPPGMTPLTLQSGWNVLLLRINNEAQHMHLANLCFPDDQFEAQLAALTADILANSWYANRVNKHALIESDSLTLEQAHSLELFKNEGVAPDAAQRVAKYFKKAAKGA